MREKYVSPRKLLRRETPSTVGLVADAEDYKSIRRYASFADVGDHVAYLQEVEGLLRALAARGVPVTVALFEPDVYASFCARGGLDPDSAASRARYTTESAAARTSVPYEGQRMDRLLDQLLREAVRRRSGEHAAALLATAGECTDCGTHVGRASFDRASAALAALCERLGEGVHHVVVTVEEDAEAPLVAVAHVDHGRITEAEALRLCTVLAAGFATGSPGGVVLRSAGTPEVVRAWHLHDSWLEPLTAGEVFNAYCTDAATGDPVPPEPGVEYAAGFALTPPEEG
ncbi:hypothetical protein [Streptomyces boninensis]|uniref:hypothetical protein n=1 Tax=Streptomyces boninensis TaxID=2039455 RepID=UPI003B214748